MRFVPIRSVFCSETGCHCVALEPVLELTLLALDSQRSTYLFPLVLGLKACATVHSTEGRQVLVLSCLHFNRVLMVGQAGLEFSIL